MPAWAEDVRFLAPIDANLGLLFSIEDPTAFLKEARACPPANTAESFAFTPCGLRDWTATRSQPLRAELFAAVPTPVVYFGEGAHPAAGCKTTLMKILPTLRAQGFDTLAMEMFDAYQQGALDDFNAGRLSVEQISQELAKDWGYNTALYAPLLELARNLHMRVIGLDHREVPDSDPVFAQNLHRRDLGMAGRIADELRARPKARIVAFTGALHSAAVWTYAGTLPSQPQILARQFGIASQSFILLPRTKGALVPTLLNRAGLVGDLFLPLPRDQAYVDGIVVFN